MDPCLVWKLEPTIDILNINCICITTKTVFYQQTKNKKIAHNLKRPNVDIAFFIFFNE